MKRHNPGDQTAKDQARQQYLKKRRMQRRATLQEAITRKVRGLVKEIVKLRSMNSQQPVEIKDEQGTQV